MRYWSKSKRLGRLSVYAHSHSLNLPRITVGIEQDAEYIAFTYGNAGCDPVIGVELDLRYTRAGRILGTVGWWLERRFRRG